MKLTKFVSSRSINISGFLLCLLLLLTSYYFEYIKDMTPCLLCLLQRWAVAILGIVFLIAAIHNPKKWGQLIYILLLLFIAGAGAAASIRQTWLQHQPSGTSTACIPPLSFLLKTRPLLEVMRLMFHGGQDCALILWQWGGLTMAEWMGVIFIGIMIVLIINSIKLLFRLRTGN